MELHQVVEAALELQTALREEGFPFCFIGGLAVQRWGEPRMTKDADATALTGFVEDERLVRALLARFRPRRADAESFALRARVLLIEASNGVGLDLALGALDFEERSVRRASPWTIESRAEIVTCAAEDLVVHKAFANRDLDWLDLDGIFMRQGGKLDVRQIFRELRPLVELKEEPAILTRLEALMRKRDVIR